MRNKAERVEVRVDTVYVEKKSVNTMTVAGPGVTIDKDDFTKAQVVDAKKVFIPNFEHDEKGKNLDRKM